MMDRINFWALSLVGRAQELKREEGQAMVEYGLILALVSIVAIAALITVGTDVVAVFTKVASSITIP